MKFLVTTGNTQTPIDQVRCITNIFSGRTGTRIALEAWRRGHDVCLLTSHPDVIRELASPLPADNRWQVKPYCTFADLHQLMESEITGKAYDAIVHVAAVSDYAVAGIYSLPEVTTIGAESGVLPSDRGQFRLLNAQGGKVKSSHPELWLRLVPTPKLVDFIRQPWCFRGVLVKFKLEVGVDEARLQEIAEESRRHSDADLIVANTREAMKSVAYLKGRAGGFVRVDRDDLAQAVVQAIESLSVQQ
jgi:phosphopantothenate-cysteine ligase/phosphopantothenoylcysteine decarboxylase/phosphopantothenate--cysteine ligase